MSRPGPAAPGRRVLDDLCALRLTDRQLDAAAACLDEVRRCQESTRLLLLEHKAVLPADHTLRQLAARRGGDRPEQEQEMLGAWFRPEVDRQLAHRRLLAAELDGLRRISAERGLRATVIKGVNNARFYQDPYPRWSRDIDLFLPTWRETYELLTALRRRGYVFDERECPWVKAEPARGREEYGQLFLILRTDAGTARVDIHFGTYSVGSGEYLRCGLADFTEPLPQASDGLLGLDPTGALLVMSAHALSDGYVSVKDVNDTVEIARNRLPVDWERLAREVEAHALGPQVRLLGEYLERRYETPTVRQFGGRLTAAARCRGRSLWAVHDRRWARRAALNAGHAFRAARATGRGTPAACRGAVRCYVHYVRRLTVDTGRRSLADRLLLRLMARADLTRWRLRPDACPTLVHSEHPALAAAAAVPPRRLPAGARPGLRPTGLPGVAVGGSFPDAQIVAIGDDVFACSWDQHVTQRQLAMLRRLASTRREGSGHAPC